MVTSDEPLPGLDVGFRDVRAEMWQAVPNDGIGWCIQPVGERRPSVGGFNLGDFSHREVALYVVELHNRDLSRRQQQ